MLAAKAFHVAAEKIMPSLVTIETYGGIATGARRGRIAGISKPGVGPTTGLIISAEGHILTSTFNFRDRPPIITVILHDQSKHVARLLGRDDDRRLCLLKIDSAGQKTKLPTAQPMPIHELRIGHWTISVGVGYGDFEPAIATGIVSAMNRYKVKAVQTDANISPANYGGPLLGIDGRVIGICVPLHPTNKAVSAGAEWYDSGIGFAIPLDGLDETIERLKSSKEPDRFKLDAPADEPAPSKAIPASNDS